MLMEIEDFKNNNGEKLKCNGDFDNKTKRNDISERTNDNRYVRPKEGLEIVAAAEKLSPPMMKRRYKDRLNDQNLKNAQTDFSKKVLPEVHQDCNCGSPSTNSRKNSPAKGHGNDKSPLKSQCQSTDHQHSRSSSIKKDAGKFSPVTGLNKSSRCDSKEISNAKPLIENEPTHMSWEEVMQEAKMLGIPLKSQTKSCQKEAHSNSEKTDQRKNFYSDGDECYRPSNSSKGTTSMASSASSIGMRQSLPDSKRPDKSPQTFRGMVKLQNFFKRLEMKHKSPCHCQSSKIPSKERHSSPKTFFRDIILSQKSKDQNKQNQSKPQRSAWRDCEECMKQCKYCRSLERASIKSRENEARAAPPSNDKDTSMARSWQPESNFDKLSLPTKSSSLNRQLQDISYQSSYSLSSKTQEINFNSRSFNAGISSVGSESFLTERITGHRCIELNTPQKAKTPIYDVNPQEGLTELRNALWYWGTLNREGANETLKDKDDGYYIVRNSSDDRYTLALSFRSQGITHHTGIEYSNGHYNFHERSPPVHPPTSKLLQDTPKENAIQFVEKASKLSKSETDRYYLQSRSTGEAVVPVKLWTPVLRPVGSLQDASVDILVRCLREPDRVSNLPANPTIKRLIRDRFHTKIID